MSTTLLKHALDGARDGDVPLSPEERRAIPERSRRLEAELDRLGAESRRPKDELRRYRSTIHPLGEVSETPSTTVESYYSLDPYLLYPPFRAGASEREALFSASSRGDGPTVKVAEASVPRVTLVRARWR